MPSIWISRAGKRSIVPFNSVSQVTVLYIGGAGRSGSTLMERLLADVDGFFPAGELRWIWERGLGENQLCSCGQAFCSCPFWTSVFDHAFGGFDSPELRGMESLRRQVDRLRYLPRVGWTQGRRNPFDTRVEEFNGRITRLYSSILQVSGASVLVDSSKDPTYAYLLERNASLDLRLVHLVRDSRAVAYSWQRIRVRPEILASTQYMPVFTPLHVAQIWTISNLLIGHLRNRFPHAAFARYEDLVGQQDYLATILQACHLDSDSVTKPDDPSPKTPLWHTVSGNPMRFDRGPLNVKVDEEWRNRLDTRSFATVTSATIPLLLRYGYSPLRHPGRPSDRA
jgi:hypothetical protein